MMQCSDTLSVSVESLEESGTSLQDLIMEDDIDDETGGGAEYDDLELLPSENEPEAWSVTVDKKTLKRMSAKNIKRQDHIWGMP